MLSCGIGEAKAPGWRRLDRCSSARNPRSVGKILAVARQQTRGIGGLLRAFHDAPDRHGRSSCRNIGKNRCDESRRKIEIALDLEHFSGGDGNGGFKNFGNGGDGDSSNNDGGKDPKDWIKLLRYLCCAALGVCVLVHSSNGSSQALALTHEAGRISDDAIWKVKDGKWTRYIVDEASMALVVDVTKMSEDEAMAYEQECLEREKNSKGKSSPSTDKAGAASTGRFRKLGVDEIVSWCLDALKTTMLPIGYPKTVSDDYTEYTLWRMGQIIASQISGVLTTQALLYAVGLGKGAIPTAAAINWVLKDGIGYLSKIVLSKYGRHFDVHPKGWRLLSDLIEDGACGLELLTPTFPHLFVPLTAVAGAGKSAAGLIQAATRSCFYAGFATQNNFAEVIAKGEAQGMVSKSLGIALGIGISSKVGSSGPLLVLSFGTVTAVHVLCNLKSYQAVQLHTLNPYRTGLIMAEYLTRQRIPSVRDVNSVEPIFTVADFFSSKKAPLSISCESKCAAADIEKNLKLGVSFGEAVASRGAAQALLDLYSGEEYLLTYDDSHCFKVVLKKSASPHDMLRAVVQASYLRHIHNQQSLSKDELLKLSYQSMQQSFNELIQGLQAAGWSTSGLVARPGSNRLG